ncbi:hypothetical protein O6B42_07060 [Campylobacter ureolyticus]|uniref:hypothetical protein n=1 Tax=Campylobacter ureolyticus TaxID=827 RepID=UPI0022B3D6F7|nr:hypothetical protein [Campylobacter ureolyticus]MCZ6133629.1 hypothetical protein [Campylobacter ureolyticus]
MQNDKQQDINFLCNYFYQNELLKLQGLEIFITSFLESLKKDDKEQELYNEILKGVIMLCSDMIQSILKELRDIRDNIQETINK